MRQIAYIGLFILLVSCTAKETKQKDSKIPAQEFDLSKITFTENLSTLLDAQKLKPEQEKSQELTLLGYETYTSTSNQLLNFNGKSLAGKSADGSNQVIIHYAADTKTIGMYELKIYTQKEGNALMASLTSLFGKPNFEKDHNTSNAIELDENGNEVKSTDREKKVYRVWENADTGLSYFLIQTGTGDHLYMELTAINRKNKSAGDWITFRSFDWYKNN